MKRLFISCLIDLLYYSLTPRANRANRKTQPFAEVINVSQSIRRSTWNQHVKKVERVKFKNKVVYNQEYNSLIRR